MTKELIFFISYVRGVRKIELELESRNIFKYSWFSYVKAVNLKAETLSLMNKPEAELDKDEKKELEKLELSFVSREISKYNDIFLKNSLIELIKTKAERVKNSDFYGYMVIISFNWKEASLYNFLRTLLHFFILLVFFTILPYDAIYNYITSFF